MIELFLLGILDIALWDLESPSSFPNNESIKEL
jgi:hypothetical protein